MWLTSMFIGNLNVFSWILPSHIVNINKLKIISQCDAKHITLLLIKTIMSVLKISTYIITSIAIFFFSYLTDFSYFPLIKKIQKLQDTVTIDQKGPVES